MKKYFYIIIILLLVSVSFSQTSNLTRKTETKKVSQQEDPIFKEIETGIKEAKVNRISKYFGQQTYFSFSNGINGYYSSCLLYTSDAADERSSVDLGGRRIIKKKNAE